MKRPRQKIESPPLGLAAFGCKAGEAHAPGRHARAVRNWPFKRAAAAKDRGEWRSSPHFDEELVLADAQGVVHLNGFRRKVYNTAAPMHP